MPVVKAKPTSPGRRFVVQPSWDEAAVPQAAHVIHLDPGRGRVVAALLVADRTVAGYRAVADVLAIVENVMNEAAGSEQR